MSRTDDPDRPQDGTASRRGLVDLSDENWVIAEPMIYEELLISSAAGIFSSIDDQGGRSLRGYAPPNCRDDHVGAGLRCRVDAMSEHDLATGVVK
jgi:uncharacterized glyoxalase superfamily metalloenzyme YdcJ